MLLLLLPIIIIISGSSRSNSSGPSSSRSNSSGSSTCVHFVLQVTEDQGSQNTGSGHRFASASRYDIMLVEISSWSSTHYPTAGYYLCV